MMQWPTIQEWQIYDDYVIALAKKHISESIPDDTALSWDEWNAKVDRLLKECGETMMYFLSLVLMTVVLQGCIEDYRIPWESIEVSKPCDPIGYQGMPIREVFLDYKRPYVLVVCMPNEQGENRWREM